MPHSALQRLIVGSSIMFLICAEVLDAGPTSVPSPPESPWPILDPERPAVPDLTESSLESSGLSSEDSEESKVPRAFQQTDAPAEVNSSMGAPSLNGLNLSFAHPLSLTLRKKPKSLNASSSSFVAPEVEALDLEQGEADSEASGFPVRSSFMLSTTSAPLTRSSMTESGAGFFRPNGPLPEATAGPDSSSLSEKDLYEDTESVLTQAPTLPETGAFPSQGPLQPDDSHQDNSEENEEMAAFPTEVDGEEVDVWKPPSSEDSDTPIVAFTEMAWHEAAEEDDEEEEAALRHGGTEYLSEADSRDSQEAVQVICVDWSDLAGKGYVVLNMTENYDCDEFRMESGDRLLDMLERTFSRKMNSPEGSWLVSLSKPTKQERQLLMTLANDQGVIPTKDVLSMLGEIRRGLTELGVQNFSSVSTCHSRPSQTQGDYGKLFVVLVIIGSVCVIIIASGLIYICWQRRLPKMKSMSRGEELHFVENGCHDNPTLDVTSDGQPEVQEKKHSANGVPAGPGAWQGLANKPGKEEDDNQEEDTHL